MEKTVICFLSISEDTSPRTGTTGRSVVELSEAIGENDRSSWGDEMEGDTMRSNARRLTLWIALTLLAAVPAGAADVRYTVPVGDSPSIGPANAPVTIVEFLDYQ
jgi:hypothetical protein